MAFAHACEPRVAEPLLRAGANVGANAFFQKVLIGSTPVTRKLEFRSLESGHRLVTFDVTVRSRREHTAKSVNDISLVTIDYISVRGLHLKTITGGPRTAT